MGRITLLLGIHNHQPVGNFEHVFREAYDRCYRPFFDLLGEYSNLRVSLHYTGPLLEWLERHEPSFLDGLRSRVETGQIELLTGGYYEPILASIPARDGAGQILMMTRHLKRRLGAEARGLWLAERVWEPSLPALLGESGVDYTLLDDTHFQAAGLDPEGLRGYYLTEREGRTLGIFPISKRLRYLIPFRPPEETIEYLGRLAGDDAAAVTYADDGEKFGLWPGTYRWVYDQGWLKRFFNLLEQNQSWITTKTFGEYRAQTPPTGRIYLPTGSYEEMMEWALPADVILKREALVERLKASGLEEEAAGFLRGGFWNHFLVKYPEINLMQKKAQYVSDQLALKGKASGRSKSKWMAEARQELYRAQGNDVYWHGLFGGYYLNYLRHAVYQHLIKAETLIEAHSAGPSVRLTEMDLDRDGYPELLVETSHMNLYLKPSDGATAIEIDYRPKAVCLTHVPMRRPEAYHQKLKTPPSASPEAGGIPSIHDRVAVKASAAEHKLVYDRHPRWSFRDHLFRSDTTLEQFETSRYEDLGGFSDQAYGTDAAGADQEKAVLSFSRTGAVEDQSLTVKKEYSLSASRAELAVRYSFRDLRLTPDVSRLTPYVWAVDLNLTLLAGADPKRYYRFPGKIVDDAQLRSRGVLDGVTETHLVDEWQGIEIRLGVKPAARLWRFPVETLSQSEEGMESNYQGSCLVVLWPLTIPAEGTREGLITMEIVER
jgi:alpha-amylase